MKIFKIILIFFVLQLSKLQAENHLIYFINEAYKNNLKLNAERKNFKAKEQDINISKSEFLPSLTIEGSQSSSQLTNRTDSSGTPLSDSNLDTQSKSINIEQKIFQGFQGYNSYKKSEIELQKSSASLKKVEQETILNTAIVYYDLILKTDTKSFNVDNVSLFERQVESDRIRLQKGEITLTDLAQSESSLAGANADLIISDTEVQNIKINFEKITGIKPPVTQNLKKRENINLKLPKTLSESLTIALKNNPELIMAKMDSLAAERDLAIEKAKLSPKATLNFSKTEKNDASLTVDQLDEEKVEAKISWPIIKGGENFASIKKSNFKNEQSKLSLKNMEIQTKSKTTNAWSNYKSSESVLNATKSQLEAAEIANEGITLEYDSGNGRTTLELIQSRSLLLEARISNANAERNFIISQFQLLKEIGNLDINIIKNT